MEEPPSFKELERDGWQRNAPFYDRRAGQLTQAVVKVALERVNLAPRMRLLDVCCGPGYGAGEAAARGAEAVGIDIATAMIAEARTRFPAATFREGDAETLDFPDSSFEAVICLFGLLHLPEAEKAVAEAFRVLQPGARYAFSVWSVPEKAKLLGIIFKAVSSHADMNVPLPAAPPMFLFSDPAHSKMALSRAGFGDLTVEEIAIDYRADSVEDIIDWVEKSTVRTTMILRLQTPDVQKRIWDAVVDGVKPFLKRGSVSIPCNALLFSGRKPPI